MLPIFNIGSFADFFFTAHQGVLKLVCLYSFQGLEIQVIFKVLDLSEKLINFSFKVFKYVVIPFNLPYIAAF